MTYQDRVSEEIRVAMARKRWNQADLARALGTYESWVSTRLRGRADIRINELPRIADALGVPMLQLLPRLDSNQEPAGTLSGLPTRPRVAPSVWHTPRAA